MVFGNTLSPGHIKLQVNLTKVCRIVRKKKLSSFPRPRVQGYLEF